MNDAKNPSYVTGRCSPYDNEADPEDSEKTTAGGRRVDTGVCSGEMTRGTGRCSPQATDGTDAPLSRGEHLCIFCVPPLNCRVFLVVVANAAATAASPKHQAILPCQKIPQF